MKPFQRFFVVTPVVSLEGLHDVIEQTKPALFPPAIGWWCLFVGVLMMFVCALLLFYHYFNFQKYEALKILKALNTKPLTNQQLGVALSQLLKRVSMVCFDKEMVASLSAEEWSLFLKNIAPNTINQEEADFIAQSSWLPPEKCVAISKNNLYNHTRAWIQFVFKKR